MEGRIATCFIGARGSIWWVDCLSFEWFVLFLFFEEGSAQTTENTQSPCFTLLSADHRVDYCTQMNYAIKSN